MYGERPPFLRHILMIIKVLVHLLLQTVFAYSIIYMIVIHQRFQERFFRIKAILTIKLLNFNFLTTGSALQEVVRLDQPVS